MYIAIAPPKRLALLLPGTSLKAYIAEAVMPPTTMRYCSALLKRMSMLDGIDAAWPAAKLDCVPMTSKLALIS